MSEHVSVETARTLRAAGLAHTFALGDWVWGKCGPEGVYSQPAWEGAGVVAMVEPDDDLDEVCLLVGKQNPLSTDRDWSAYFDRREVVWLPTAGQLLQELAQRKAPYTLRCISLPGGYSWMLTVRDWITGNGPDLAEAAALALLAVLQEEVQG